MEQKVFDCLVVIPVSIYQLLLLFYYYCYCSIIVIATMYLPDNSTFITGIPSIESDRKSFSFLHFLQAKSNNFCCGLFIHLILEEFLDENFSGPSDLNF